MVYTQDDYDALYNERTKKSRRSWLRVIFVLLGMRSK